MRGVENFRPGPEMDAVIAATVMGWKDVRRESRGAAYRGKRPDKLGRFRSARVPPYSTDPREAAVLGARLEQIGRLPQFRKQLEKTAHAKGVPIEWAPPVSRRTSFQPMTVSAMTASISGPGRKLSLPRMRAS